MGLIAPGPHDVEGDRGYTASNLDRVLAMTDVEDQGRFRAFLADIGGTQARFALMADRGEWDGALADVNAAPFYERMGARFLRNAPSDAIPGRSLPLYEYDLTSGARS